VERLDPLVEGVQLLTLDRQLLEGAPDEIGELRSSLFELLEVLGERLLRRGGGLQPGGRFLHQPLDPAHGLLDHCRLPRAVAEPGHLHVHVPDQLVQSIRFHHRVLDRVFLILEHLDLLHDMLSHGVECRQTRVGALAQFVELRQRAELLFDIADRLDRRGGLLAGFAQRVTEPCGVLRQLTRHTAQAIEIGLQRRRPGGRLLQLSLRHTEPLAELVERALVLPHRIEHGDVLRGL
jgi:hypothetical protein